MVSRRPRQHKLNIIIFTKIECSAGFDGRGAPSKLKLYVHCDAAVPEGRVTGAFHYALVCVYDIYHITVWLKTDVVMNKPYAEI